MQVCSAVWTGCINSCVPAFRDSATCGVSLTCHGCPLRHRSASSGIRSTVDPGVPWTSRGIPMWLPRVRIEGHSDGNRPTQWCACDQGGMARVLRIASVSCLSAHCAEPRRQRPARVPHTTGRGRSCHQGHNDPLSVTPPIGLYLVLKLRLDNLIALNQTPGREIEIAPPDDPLADVLLVQLDGYPSADEVGTDYRALFGAGRRKASIVLSCELADTARCD